MNLVLDHQPVPLAVDADGVVRVGGTRVTLETVVGAFKDGSTAEQIADDYPVLKLADVYAVITYYLNHRERVEQYLADQRRGADEIRREVEARFDPQGIRDRLIRRRMHEDQQNASPPS